LIHLNDGATMAHLGYPDMRVPISYALNYPSREDVPLRALDLAEIGSLTFEPVDREAFACIRLAEEAGKAGGSTPCVMNAANEIAVAAFRGGELPFLGIAEVIERTMDAIPTQPIGHFSHLATVDEEARIKARQFAAEVSV
jgi:1-deoxy-D-xylulose-5-phosphate reductoisomerase